MARTSNSSAKKSSTDGNKGGRPGWATQPQGERLHFHLPAYTAAQGTAGSSGTKGARLAEFWPHVWDDWFGKWPENDLEGNLLTGRALEDATAQTKKRIKQWYNNHTRGHSTRTSASTGDSRGKILNLAAKKKKKLQIAQAYSHLYYATKLKAIVAERWKVENPAESATVKPSFAFRNKVIKELYEEEPDSIKEKVMEYRDSSYQHHEQCGEEDENDGISPEEVQRRTEARKYQQALECLPHTLTRLVEQIEAETGMVCSVLVGGPEPCNGGNLLVMTYHQGKTKFGTDFPASYPGEGWMKYVEKPFTDFIGKVFPKEIRDSRALPGTLDLALLGDDDSDIDRETDTSETDSSSTRSLSPCLSTAPINRRKPKILSKRMDSARDSPEVDWRSRYEMEKDENIARIREQMEAISDDIAAKANTWPNQHFADRAGSSIQADSNSNNGTPGDHGRDCGAHNADVFMNSNSPTASPTSSIMGGPNSRASSINRGTELEGYSAEERAFAPGSLLHNPPLPRNTASVTPNLASSSASGHNAPREPFDKSKWPTWLQASADYLLGVSEFAEWKITVNKYLIFEGQLDIVTTGNPRLGCSGRPEAVREWLKYGRKYNIPPALGNIDSFIKSWWTWWQMLQPEWRKSGNGSATEMTRVAPPGDPDWSNTAKTGTNGLLIVMMTLSWWMGAVTGTDCWGAFCVALDDVSFVLDQIISAYPVRQASAQ